MVLTQKETELLKDLKTQEQLCIQKYGKYACDAHDTQLKDLFDRLCSNEKEHYNTVTQMMSGTVPQIPCDCSKTEKQGGFTATYNQMTSSQDKNDDSYLCSDALSMEKHVSAVYNTSLFEFSDVNARNMLNHIQKEEQEHGEQLYAYMSANSMYC